MIATGSGAVTPSRPCVTNANGRSVVLHPGSDVGALERRLAGELGRSLGDLGVAKPVVRIERCHALERDPAKMGKLRLVVAQRAS